MAGPRLQDVRAVTFDDDGRVPKIIGTGGSNLMIAGTVIAELYPQK